ncbi:MAG: FG-GAP repeat domain-containing protein [Phycisphaerales bacterium]
MNRSFALGASALALVIAAGAARADVVVSYGPGTSPVVRTFTPRGDEVGGFEAYDRGFAGGVRVATGDVTGDGTPDVITVAGPGGNGHVKVFDGNTGAEVRSFFAFDGFVGGVQVAAGDVNGDGTDDIITGAGGGGAAGGHVKVFSGATGAEIRSFFAFPGFVGGVTVAAGDVTGDGKADIITGAGPGAPGGHVKVFDGVSGAQVRSFFAFGGFDGGVSVAAGDLDGDGLNELVVGAASLASHVKVFDGASLTERASFLAFEGFNGGLSLAVGDVDSDGRSDLLAGALSGEALVNVFSASLRARGPDDPFIFLQPYSFLAAPPGFDGGVYVAAIPAPAVGGLAAVGLALAARRRR